VEHTLNEIIPIAEEKRISIDLDMTASSEALSFEPIRLEQVVMNLLDNACKFTPRSGRIQVKGYPYFWERRLSGNTGPSYPVERRTSETSAPNSYRVDISDSGPGIAPAHLSRIFEEYTSYGGGTDRSGGGLGLAICRMIINQHKGRIWAESSPLGAVFSFVLPFVRSSAGAGDQTVRLAQAAM
jgi:signal transduction histidine kinase